MLWLDKLQESKAWAANDHGKRSKVSSLSWLAEIFKVWCALGSLAEISLWTGNGNERGRRKREPVGMAKDFNFQIPVVYVMFKLTIHVTSTLTTTNFAQVKQLRSWGNTILSQNQKICQFIKYLTKKPHLSQMKYMEIEFLGHPYRPPYSLPICINLTCFGLRIEDKKKVVHDISENKKPET